MKSIAKYSEIEKRVSANNKIFIKGKDKQEKSVWMMHMA